MAQEKDRKTGAAPVGHDTTHAQPVRYDVSLLSDEDLYLFNEGSHHRLYEKLGAHCMTAEGYARHLFCRLGAQRQAGISHG